MPDQKPSPGLPRAILSLAVLPDDVAEILHVERNVLDPLVGELVAAITNQAQGRSHVAFGISLMVAEFLGAIYQAEKQHGEPSRTSAADSGA